MLPGIFYSPLAASGIQDVRRPDLTGAEQGRQLSAPVVLSFGARAWVQTHPSAMDLPKTG